jgi:hypothetical protein
MYLGKRNGNALHLAQKRLKSAKRMNGLSVGKEPEVKRIFA